MAAVKVVQPVGLQYVSLQTPFETAPKLHIMFYYRLNDPGKIYNIQYTSDGITFFNGGSVTGPARPTFTIDPTQNLWPQIVEA